MKIKIGRDNAEEDLDRIAAVKKLIGPKRRLFVDANQRWNVADCMIRLQKLAAFDLGWVEEPLHAEDIRGHADLRRIAALPIALGESLYTRHQLLTIYRPTPSTSSKRTSAGSGELASG
nr:enolase C-terminal domain-like protein [Mesorhizobium sp.]